MNKAEARRVAVAEAEIVRLRAENIRLTEIINNLIHRNARLMIAVRDVLSAVDEVRDDVEQ